MVAIRQRKNIVKNEMEFRDTVFPGAQERLWDKSSGGFVTIPKTMPFICRILDEMSKNQPLSDTYRMLWAYTWDNNAFVRLNKMGEMAFAAGFAGQRGERTLRDRLKKLEALGFIEIRSNGNNPMGLVFIPNPHEVILRIRDAYERATSDAERARLPLLRDESYFSFVERALEINCKDIPALAKKINAENEGSSPSDDKPAETTSSAAPSGSRKKRLPRKLKTGAS